MKNLCLLSVCWTFPVADSVSNRTTFQLVKPSAVFMDAIGNFHLETEEGFTNRIFKWF